MAEVSGFRTIRYVWVSRDGATFGDVRFINGLIMFEYGDATAWRLRSAPPRASLERVEGGYWETLKVVWLFGADSGWFAGLKCVHWPWGWSVGVSLLYPVLLTAGPAALLWYADRRRSAPGSCGRCGYDRRGLAVGVKCPECGATPGGG